MSKSTQLPMKHHEQESNQNMNINWQPNWRRLWTHHNHFALTIFVLEELWNEIFSLKLFCLYKPYAWGTTEWNILTQITLPFFNLVLEELRNEILLLNHIALTSLVLKRMDWNIFLLNPTAQPINSSIPRYISNT